MVVEVDPVEVLGHSQCSAPAGEQESEVSLSKEITALWSAHQDGKASAKRTKEDLKAIRRDLGERLHAMKTLLARTGRGGQWTSYLREHKISRTTADRWSREHEESRNPGSTKRTDGAITDPTADDVKKFFQRLLPRLRSTLTTYDAVYYFVHEMHFKLPNCNSEMTDQGILVLGPTQQGEAQ